MLPCRLKNKFRCGRPGHAWLHQARHQGKGRAILRTLSFRWKAGRTMRSGSSGISSARVVTPAENFHHSPFLLRSLFHPLWGDKICRIGNPVTGSPPSEFRRADRKAGNRSARLSPSALRAPRNGCSARARRAVPNAPVRRSGPVVSGPWSPFQPLEFSL